MLCAVYVFIEKWKKINMNLAPLFQFIERFTYNYSAICKMPGNQVEKLYSKYAIKLEEMLTDDAVSKKNRDKNVQRIFSQLMGKLKELRPPYEQFEQNFEEIRYKHSSNVVDFLRYTLSGINSLYDTGELVPDFNQVNIEHILPQRPSKDWALKKEDIVDYVDKLWNLTLLSTTINKKAGNKNIKEKVEHLEGSDIKLTQQVAKSIKKDNYAWDESTIVQRQKEFCALAYEKVWSLD